MLHIKILPLLLSLAHDPREDPAVRQARLERVAEDIDLAVALGQTPFRGPAASDAAAVALVAIGQHESGFRAAVGNCLINGDGGRSVTFYQLMRGAAWDGHTRADLCPSGPLAAYLALGVLNRYTAPCKVRTPIAFFRAYAAGSCAAASRAATDICEAWQSLSAKAGLVGARCDKATTIDVAKPVTVAKPAPGTA